MEIKPSARRHAAERNIRDDDIRHAIAHPFRMVEQEHDGDERMLIIGADASGRPPEVVVVPVDDPDRVIHADVLREKFNDYL